MKNIGKIILVLALVGGLVSCEDNETRFNDSFLIHVNAEQLEGNALTINGDFQTVIFDVVTEMPTGKWNVIAPLEDLWCSFLRQGSRLLLSVADNNADTSRSTWLEFSLGNNIRRIELTQDYLRITTPPSAPGNIQGDAVNMCPEPFVSLSIARVNHASSYQWYRNGIAIDGAVGLTHTAIESGIYTVTAVNLFGESEQSQGRAITVNYCPVYEDFLGTYTLYYSIVSANPTSTASIEVSIVPAVQGISYHLIGLLQDEDVEQGGVIELLFTDRGIEFPGNRVLFIRPGNQHFTLMAVMTDGNNNRTTRPEAGLMGVDYQVFDGQLLSFSTACRGITGGVPVQGFIFRDFPNNENVNTTNRPHKGGDHRLYHPRFVKHE